jgi:hypothetical protein
VTVVLIISVSAIIVFSALQPVTIKVEYWLTSRTDTTIQFKANLLLQGCDNIMLNVANFTLNDIYHPVNTFNYPLKLNRNEIQGVILAFSVPAETNTYTLAYHGIRNCTFIFNEISG